MIVFLYQVHKTLYSLSTALTGHNMQPSYIFRHIPSFKLQHPAEPNLATVTLEAVCSSKMSDQTNYFIQCKNPEDSHLSNTCCECFDTYIQRLNKTLSDYQLCGKMVNEPDMAGSLREFSSNQSPWKLQIIWNITLSCYILLIGKCECLKKTFTSKQWFILNPVHSELGSSYCRCYWTHVTIILSRIIK